MINKFQRYQQGLKMEHFYPINKEGFCACGCGQKLTGRQKKWASEFCSEKAYSIFSIYKGNNGMIRKLLFEKDGGFCRNCGVYHKNWEADHIIPVFLGGGFSGIDNFQTLCPECHNEKSKIQIFDQRASISSHADSIEDITLLNALEEVL